MQNIKIKYKNKHSKKPVWKLKRHTHGIEKRTSDIKVNMKIVVFAYLV